MQISSSSLFKPFFSSSWLFFRSSELHNQPIFSSYFCALSQAKSFFLHSQSIQAAAAHN